MRDVLSLSLWAWSFVTRRVHWRDDRYRVTRSGGGPYTALSAGLDGSSIVSIYTNPNRSSHEAYAVTLKGVYYMADSIASASNPEATPWRNKLFNAAQSGASFVFARGTFFGMSTFAPVSGKGTSDLMQARRMMVLILDK